MTRTRARRVTRGAGVLAAVVAVAGAGAWARSAVAPPVSVPPPHGDAVRGLYLAAVFSCLDCHTARAADGFSLDATRLMVGGTPLAGPWGVVHAANVTRVAPALGDNDLTQGIRGQLGYLYAMPTPAYNQLADADVRDIVAYLRTLRRVLAPIPTDSIRAGFTPPPPEAPRLVPAVAPEGATAARGAYLTRSEGCGDCHTPHLPNGAADPARTFVGNATLPAANPQHYVAPNITPDPEAGIGRWTDAQIIDVIRLGRAPDGHQINPVMPYATSGHMYTDADALAIVRYLRTIAPVRNAMPHNPAWRAVWQPGPWLHVPSAPPSVLAQAAALAAAPGASSPGAAPPAARAGVTP